MKKKTAFITGITGQDGSYLAEFLLEKNYRVVGLSRNRNNQLQYLEEKIELILGDITHADSISSIIEKIEPDEIYHLASLSHPGKSWTFPLETAHINGLSAHQLFEMVRQIKPECRIYQASSSEMYGNTSETPQNENTPFQPINPYGASKLYAHQIAHIYRKSYNMFISCGILFNHESPRKGVDYLTQKVTYAAACLKQGIETSSLLNEQGEPILANKILSLGNLDSKRDWGYAGDYIKAMWLMLQHPNPEDFVIGTGMTHSIKELCEIAFSYVNLNWENHIKIDPRFFRPVETGPTIADSTKAKKLLGWEPTISFETLIKMMIDAHCGTL